MGQVEDVEEFISSLVLSYWGERKVPCLLSAIGLKARRQFPDFRPPKGDGILEFCRGISTVQIVIHPTIPQKIGLIPATVQVPADVSALFEHNDTQQPDIVYEDHFWRAFIGRPVSKRFVCLKNDGGFGVVESDKKPDLLECFEITPADLTTAAPDTPTADKAKITADRIDVWIKRNNLDRSIFEKRRVRDASRRHSNTALDRFIETVRILQVEDQKRISIPFDLIVKLKDSR
jgi:hypothetical protein